MLHLSSGVRLDGDDEIVFRTVDLEQAGGDGLYVADIAEAAGLPEERVREVVEGLVAQEVLSPSARDDQLGARYVTGPAR
jgi:DNA-binding IclR family transcriptional regulator